MDRFFRSRAGARSRDGQVLVIVAAGMFVLIAMVGLIIDGGNALGQQRRAQNAADGIAMSGTAVIQDYLSGTGTTPTAGDVGCAVETAADAHDIDLEKAEFTNYQGTVIGLVPACGSAAVIPAGSQGVKGSSTEDFETFLMRAVGFGTMTTKANATAVVGNASRRLSGVGGMRRASCDLPAHDRHLRRDEHRDRRGGRVGDPGRG